MFVSITEHILNRRIEFGRIVAMMEIKVHKYNQFYMWILGIHSFDVHKPTIDSYKSPLVYYGTFVGLFALVSSVMFFYEHLYEVKEALEAFKIFAAGFQSISCSYIMVFKMKKVKALHVKLQKIVDEGTQSNSLYIFKLEIS